MEIDLLDLLNRIYPIIIALGIFEFLKKLLLSKSDEIIENRKLDLADKRKIRDNTLSFISLGKSSDWKNFPDAITLSNIYKDIYKIDSFEKKLASEIESFLFDWQLYTHAEGEKMKELKNQVYSKLDKQSQSIIRKINGIVK